MAGLNEHQFSTLLIHWFEKDNTVDFSELKDIHA